MTRYSFSPMSCVDCLARRIDFLFDAIGNLGARRRNRLGFCQIVRQLLDALKARCQRRVFVDAAHGVD